MSGENNNHADDKSDVDENAENYDALDDVLNDDEDGDGKDDKEGKDDKDGSSDKDGDGDDKDGDDKKFYKKVGTHEFHSEKDYDEFVTKTHGTNTQFAGEIKRLGGDAKHLGKEKVDEKKPDEKKPDENKDEDAKKIETPMQTYYKIEGIRFQKQFPDSDNYKPEMKVFLQNGKADINGEPSFSVAYAKSLRADGKEIPEKLLKTIKSEKGIEVDESQSATKKIMRSGGNAGSVPSQDTYSNEEKEGLSSEGDDIALGRF